MVENCDIFSTSLKSNILQDPTITCVQKCFSDKKFATNPRNGSFGAFWWKHSQKPLGAKSVSLYLQKIWMS